MGKGGRYLKKAPVAGRRKKNRILPIILIILVLILALCGVGAYLYFNHLIGMVGRPGTVETVPMSDEELSDMLGTLPTAPMVGPTEETTEASTSPEDTWPQVVSDQKITNIMLVGQAEREGEPYRLSDSMILCSINRETKTLTLTSFMRDLRVTIPAYAGHTQGFNRMNVCYHLGSHWTGETKGSMEMLALAVEQNFGVPVDHTVEIDFDIFMKVIDLLGGLTIDFNADEIKYMIDNYGNYEKNHRLVEGPNHVDGWQALCYARARKVGHGDFERTERQREVISLILKRMMKMSIMDVNNIFTQALPLVVTDMTDEEIRNYAFEFIPMLTGLTIQSQRIPFDDTYWSTNAGTDESPDWVIDANLKKNGELLRQSIGMVETAD